MGPVGQHAEDYVVVSIPVEICHRARPGPVRCHIVAGDVSQCVPIRVGGRILAVIMVIGEYQVEVAVLVQVVLMDALEHSSAGHVQVVARVAESARAEPVESLSCPDQGLLHGDKYLQSKL